MVSTIRPLSLPSIINRYPLQQNNEPIPQFLTDIERPLTDCQLVTPYEIIGLGQQWIWVFLCLTTLSHSEPMLPYPCGIGPGAITQEVLMNLIHNVYSVIILSKIVPHFQRADEFKWKVLKRTHAVHILVCRRVLHLYHRELCDRIQSDTFPNDDC